MIELVYQPARVYYWIKDLIGGIYGEMLNWKYFCNDENASSKFFDDMFFERLAKARRYRDAVRKRR